MRIEARRQRLKLHRNDGQQLTTVDASLPLLRLGVALLAATQALVGHE